MTKNSNQGGGGPALTAWPAVEVIPSKVCQVITTPCAVGFYTWKTTAISRNVDCMARSITQTLHGSNECQQVLQMKFYVLDIGSQSTSNDVFFFALQEK